MEGKRLKFLVLGSAIFGVMALLVVFGMTAAPGGMVYYLTVDEFLAQSDRTTRGFRVNGTVVEGSIERLPSGSDVRFVMLGENETVPVQYSGIIPDTFVDRAAVVVEGKLQDDGTFVAHELLAKCPSKYEAADGAEATQAPTY